MKAQLATTNAVEFEEVKKEKEKLTTLVEKLNAEIEILKVTKLDLDEQVTKSKYQIENCQVCFCNYC